MDSNLLRTKSIEQLVGEAARGGKGLRRALSAFDLTLLGIGAIIGTGIFVLTGTAAANQAGPAITVSYLVAGLACAFAALCYAEFAAMIPISGSAYTYAYATLGELVAWMIGWDLILEYAVGSMTVAIGWSGYFQRILDVYVGLRLPAWMAAAPGSAEGAILNLPAVLIALLVTAILVVGVRESARVNSVMVVVKLAVVLFFIAVGARRVDPANWSPFMPYGWGGVMAAGGVVFFAYIGFDAVSTTAEEATHPQRDLPIGIITSLILCTLLYVMTALVLSGLVPVVALRTNAEFLNAPVAFGLAHIGMAGASGLISVGAVAGITSVLLVMMMSQPRIFFSMSRDQLLPAGVSRVHPTFKTPYVTTMITGVVVATAAGLIPINVVGEMTSIGTLFAFGVVCAAVMILRRKRPEAHRPFKVPGGDVVPLLGILFCGYLMLFLSVATWVRFLVWLDLGLIIYWFYGRTHSTLRNAKEQDLQGTGERAANFLTVFGGLATFNGLCMAVQGYMTELGIKSEELAKWHELGVSPEQADQVGLGVLAIGVLILVAGIAMNRTVRASSVTR